MPPREEAVESALGGGLPLGVPRLLYFDIDGVLFDYHDKPKPALVDGRFRRVVADLGFDRLVCVSGWSDMVHAPVLRIPESARARAIAEQVATVFDDSVWLIERLELTTDTDHRCRHIDLGADWFYIDDWADHFFGRQFGMALFREHLGRRICMPDPRGRGDDIMQWLSSIAPR